jgi:hypothetical protein
MMDLRILKLKEIQVEIKGKYQSNTGSKLIHG